MEFTLQGNLQLLVPPLQLRLQLEHHLWLTSMSL